MFLNQSGFFIKKQYRKLVVSGLTENNKNSYFFIKFKFQILRPETAQFLNSTGFYNNRLVFSDLQTGLPLNFS
jgi:hypothetical protein